jgi:hypothetical protein
MRKKVKIGDTRGVGISLPIYRRYKRTYIGFKKCFS